MTRHIGTIRRVAAGRDTSRDYQPPDFGAIAKQVGDHATIGRLPDGSGKPLITVVLFPDGNPVALPEPGERLADWLKGHFPRLSDRERIELAAELGPVIAGLYNEAAQLSRGGNQGSPVLLLSAWPGRTKLERCARMLLTRRGVSFARLSWEEKLECASQVLRAHRHV